MLGKAAPWVNDPDEEGVEGVPSVGGVTYVSAMIISFYLSF
jgi:hypothetical protein